MATIEEQRAAYFDLHAEAEALGIPTDHHESDLYLPDTAEVRALLRAYPFKHSQLFRSNIDGTWWHDVPFAYTPFWARKAAR